MSEDSCQNIVLVTADSLRADHCGFVNHNSDLTPTMDTLANEGVSYTQAIAPGPRTPSSVPVLSTGEFMSNDDEWTMHDWEHRQQRIGHHMNRFVHISERLRQRGYQTAAFTANPWTTRETNFDAGFDEFFEISADSEDVSSDYLSDSLLFKIANAGFDVLPIDVFGWNSKKEWFSQWTGYFDLISEQLKQLEEPFFLWIFILDSHQPYISPRKYRKESSAWQMYYSILRYWQGKTSDGELPEHAKMMITQAYRDAVRSVDGFVKKLEEEINQFDPVLVFTSDHGEALGEHGNFGHEQTLYDENLRVPFFIHNVSSSINVESQFPLKLLPNLLTDIGDSVDFDPHSYTQPVTVSKVEDNHKNAVRTNQWKLIRNENTDRLYNLDSDPEELVDVSSEYRHVTSILGDVLTRHEATQIEKDRIEKTLGVMDSEGIL
ncbi:sulfatase-like hydrolase/transferase [Haloferax namakaokahaiae]|uniref:Sulfatase-like hydrolase/transferase n=1 Tax=Haloferax namakaokahaiae TaxID=1748331 RepID=A0ABD5ZBR8_9EURY